MCNQLRVALFKLRHFWIFYLAAAGMGAAGFSYGNIKLAEIGFDVYEAFAEANCDTSFVFILALVTAWFMGSDFSNRTIQHGIALGHSRWSVLGVRVVPAILSGIVLHCVYVFSTMIGVGVRAGFDGGRFTVRDILWYAVILLQLSAIQGIVTLITFICAKAPGAIAASVCIIFIGCNLLRNFFDGVLFTRSVFCFVRENGYEILGPTSVAAAVTLAASIALTHFIFRKKEIR